MSTKTEGVFPCKVLTATAGADDKGVINVQINVQITDGPDKGVNCTYEDQVNAKSAPYVTRSCRAVGWQGQDIMTLRDDAQKWIEKTGGASTVEIHHVEIKKGKKFDQWVAGGRKGDAPIWDKVRSIGRGPRVLNQPKKNDVDEANEALRLAMESSGNYGDEEEIPF